VFLFAPILGGILAIIPLKSIAIWFNNLFGLDAYKGVLDQEGGLAFVMVSCVSLPVVE